MRWLLVLALAAVACGGSAGRRQPAAAATDPDRFVSTDGHFSVVFPSKPELSRKEIPSDAGAITIHEAGVAQLSSDTPGAFTVSYADLPSPAMRLAETMRALVRKPPRVLLSEQEIEVTEGVRGYEIVYEEDVLEKTGRFFQVGPRYFQILVEYPKGKRPAGMRSFIESFELR